jgi:hypothetical protein
MNRTVSLAVSTAFHPVFVNLMGLLLLIFLSPYLNIGLSSNAQLFYVLFIFISAGIVPMVVVLAMRGLGKVQSILLNAQDERNIPYLVTACMYLFDFYFLERLHAPALIRAYVLACACIVVSVVIINHFYKISIHGASLGALTAVIATSAGLSAIDIRYALIVVFVISGITLSARLFLYAHTLTQVVTGWMLGFLVMYLIL